MQNAEVVVVGAGVIGASIAHHLAQRGCRRVMVIDRAPTFGGGSTARATGGFRAQFSSRVNIQLSLLSRRKLQSFEQDTGVDPGYVQRGYLFLARSGEALEALHTANRLQRSCGLHEARMITPDEARQLNPALSDDAITGGAFCPTDGFIRPMEVLRGYAESAQRSGIEFAFGVECNGFVLSGGRIVAASTSRGPVGCDAVVNAAGAWAGLLSSVPVKALRRRVVPTVPTAVLPESMPMTIWVDDGYHLRVRDGRVLLLWPDEAPFGFEDTAADGWLDAVEEKTRSRVAALRGVPIDRPACWAGFYEMSPDRHAILGRSPEVENLFLANGSSGHGVMHSPAIGQLIAEVIVEGRASSMDIHALRPARFAEGDLIQSSELL